MDTHPQLEPLPRLERFDRGAEEPWRNSFRARLFFLVFGLTLLAGLVLTFLQPRVYRSSATVLMSSPTALDAEVAQEDIQNIAIQRQILLGTEITDRLLTGLQQQGADIGADGLRRLLHVEPVPGTNLVEMSAEGEDAALLPTVVNTWIDVYLAVSADEMGQRKAQTVQVVQEELDGLAVRLEQARTALDDYRREHGIISAERQENEVLSRLDGLNKALNNAVEEEAKTRAYLDTLRASIARGDPVVPKDQRRDVEGLGSELQELQAQMSDAERRYTPEYIAKQPKLRAVQQRIAELQGQLSAALSQGRNAELATATQANLAAQQTVVDLQRQLDEHKQQVAEFNAVYAKHQALADDLAGLEQLNRDTQARLTKVELNRVEKYPQVSVIDRPGPRSERIGPDYPFLLGGSVLLALVLGVFSVWLHGFLSPKREQPAYVTLSGVHLYPQEVSGQLAYTAHPDPRLARDPALRLAREEPPPGQTDAGTENGADEPTGRA